jgi:hypothetical protein
MTDQGCGPKDLAAAAETIRTDRIRSYSRGRGVTVRIVLVQKKPIDACGVFPKR